MGGLDVGCKEWHLTPEAADSIRTASGEGGSSVSQPWTSGAWISRNPVTVPVSQLVHLIGTPVAVCRYADASLQLKRETGGGRYG